MISVKAVPDDKIVTKAAISIPSPPKREKVKVIEYNIKTSIKYKDPHNKAILEKFLS